MLTFFNFCDKLLIIKIEPFIRRKKMYFLAVTLVIVGFICTMHKIRKGNKQIEQKNQNKKKEYEDLFIETTKKVIETLRCDKQAGPLSWQKMSKEQLDQNRKIVREWITNLNLTPEAIGSTRKELIELGIIKDLK